LTAALAQGGLDIEQLAAKREILARAVGQFTGRPAAAGIQLFKAVNDGAGGQDRDVFRPEGVVMRVHGALLVGLGI
jgi:hypothetical protein